MWFGGTFEQVVADGDGAHKWTLPKCHLKLYLENRVVLRAQMDPSRRRLPASARDCLNPRKPCS
jgi:hypothetical protein